MIQLSRKMLVSGIVVAVVISAAGLAALQYSNALTVEWYVEPGTTLTYLI